MTAYNAAVVMERDLKHTLEADGYYVTRAAGSKGKADLIAFGHGRTLLIQAKRGARPIGVAEWNLLVDWARAGGPSCVPVLASRQPRKPVVWQVLTDYRKAHSAAMPCEPLLLGEAS